MGSRRELFLDTSVVIYAAGAAHPLREACRRSLRRVVEDDVPLVTSSEALQEILHRYWSLGRRREAATVFHAMRDLCTRIVPVEETDAARAHELLQDSEGLSPRHAVLVSVMERHEIDRVLSTDAALDAVDSLQRIDPETWLE